MHREKAGDHGRGTVLFQQFGPQHAAQVCGEGARVLAGPRLVDPVGGCPLHGSYPFLEALPLLDRPHLSRCPSACLTPWDFPLTVGNTRGLLDQLASSGALPLRSVRTCLAAVGSAPSRRATCTVGSANLMPFSSKA